MLYFLLKPIIHVEEDYFFKKKTPLVFSSFLHRQIIMLGKCGVGKNLSVLERL